LDIGGGRFNLVTNYLKDIGVTNLIYDPFCRDSRENQATADYLIETGLVDTVTCCNVLNVIPSEQERAGVILMAALALKEGGKAFFQVYEKDKHGTGTVSLRRTYQTNRRAREYLEEVERFFDDVVVKKNTLVASWPNYACCRESGQLLYNQGIQYQLQGDRFEAGSVIDLSELLRRD
jgi:anion-transporting  ArsA/GET3 family ATPase